MSIFFIYFEKNNPHATWTDFRQKNESVLKTFERVINYENPVWYIEPAQIVINKKNTHAFIIHDGISSDQVFIRDFKNTVIVRKRKDLLSFFDSRLSITSINCFFIFHLYNGEVAGHFENVKVKEFKVLQLADIGGFSGVVDPEVLYQILR